MATIQDAVQLVTDPAYVVQPVDTSEKLHELQVGRIVEALLERGAASHDDARELLHEAVEGLGEGARCCTRREIRTAPASSGSGFPPPNCGTHRPGGAGQGAAGYRPVGLRGSWSTA